MNPNVAEVLVRLLFAYLVATLIIAGYLAFLFIGFLDPNAPPIEAEFKEVVLALGTMAGGAATWVFTQTSSAIAALRNSPPPLPPPAYPDPAIRHPAREDPQ